MNEKFISGEWYEEQYRNENTRYHSMYVLNGIPLGAQHVNNYYADLFGMIYGLGKDAKVLELGTGVGCYMDSWLRKGADVTGVEISRTAIRVSKHRRRIVHGSVRDLSMFRDDEFDLVTSLALLEHLDESILDESIAEMNRVGIRQAHLATSEEGGDESHITLKKPEEWVRRFADVIASNGRQRQTVFNLPDYLMRAEGACLICSSEWDLLPQPTRVWLIELDKKMKEDQNVPANS